MNVRVEAELAELVADHVLGDVDRDELSAVVHGDGVTHAVSGGSSNGATRCEGPSCRCVSFMTLIFVMRWSSIKGPFLVERAIY